MIDLLIGAGGLLVGIIGTAITVIKSLTGLENRIASLETWQRAEVGANGEFRQLTDQRLRDLESKISALATRQDNHSAALTRIESRIDRIENKMDNLLAEIRNLSGKD